MAKPKLYPYCENGDVPSFETVEKFKDKNPKNPMCLPPVKDEAPPREIILDQEEMERMWRGTKDWTTVYAMLNMD